MKPQRVAAVVLLVLVTIVAAFDLSRTPFAFPQRELLDFRVAYCAGAAIVERRDPYRVEPIRTCEHAHSAPLLDAIPNLVMPWVLPGYVAVLAVPFALLPFAFAVPVFLLCLFAAVITAAILVARSTGASLMLTLTAIASAAFPSYVLGQIAPFEVLAIAATATALRAKDARLAGIFAAATLLEPHVGLFVCVAVAVAMPRARIALAASVVVLAIVACVATGPAAQVAYVVQDLPLQGVGQAGSHEQYSLTYALVYAGVPESAALLIGSISTVALLVVSTVLAVRLARAKDMAYVAYVPAALAVIGGTYVHLPQMLLAVPAALLVHRDASSPLRRTIAAIALVLIAVPWPYPSTFKLLLPATLLAVGLMAFACSGKSLIRTIGAAAVCWLVLFPIENHNVIYPRVEAARRAPPDEFATISVAEVTRGQSAHDAFLFVVKSATWTGLVLLLGSLCVAIPTQPLPTNVRRPQLGRRERTAGEPHNQRG